LTSLFEKYEMRWSGDKVTVIFLGISIPSKNKAVSFSFKLEMFIFPSSGCLEVDGLQGGKYFGCGRLSAYVMIINCCGDDMQRKQKL